MNLPPFFQSGCDRPTHSDAPGPWRRLVRVVRSRRPSLRTFVVVADAKDTPLPWEDPSEVATYFLAARREEDIEIECWHRDDSREDPHNYPSAKELWAAGFRFVRREATREFVVVCPTHGSHLTTTAQLRHQWWNELQIVACTWPRDEDERRLREIAEQVSERLLFRLTHPTGTPNPQRQRPLGG